MLFVVVVNEFIVCNDDEVVVFYGFIFMELVFCYIEIFVLVCFWKLLLLKVVFVVVVKGCVFVWRSGNCCFLLFFI